MSSVVNIVRRVIWFGVTLIFTIVIYISYKDYDVDKKICYSRNITYPKTFNQNIGWRQCECDTIFCTDTCYCVTIYNEDGIAIKGSNTNCTFESNIIPFVLNFQPILDMYYDKSFDCYYDNYDKTYFIDHKIITTKATYNTFIGMIVIICICCFFIECFKSKDFTNTDIAITNTTSNQEQLPEYEEDIPPPYNEEVV